MAYLITGRAGSGKSTICLELKRHGWLAYDADEVPGLADWIDRKTGKITAVDYLAYVDYNRVGWNWNKAVLATFLKTHPQATFLCGSASNQLEAYDLFEQVFILDLDPHTHRQRLETRRNSDYAKDPRQIREILQEQRELVDKSLILGATPINASQPLDKVVSQLRRHLG